jgi:cobalt-zinc-cadmium efflux system outer membrane protein
VATAARSAKNEPARHSLRQHALLETIPRRCAHRATAALLLLAAPARAQQPAAWTLDRVLATALRQNPDVVLARLAVDSARAEQGIARALPNPTYSVIPGTPFQQALAATIDLGPQRLLRTQAAGRGTAATRLALADVTRQVTFRVRQAFYDVMLADSLRAIARERRDIFRDLLAADSVRWKSGDVPERNVTKSELDLASAEADLARANAEAHGARLRLQTLLGRAAPDTGFAITGSLAYQLVNLPLDSLESFAEQNRPDVAAAGARIGQTQSLRALATAELFPTPTLSVVYQSGAPFPNGSNYAVGVSLAVPLFYWNGGERARAAAGVASAEAARHAVRTLVAAELAVAIDSFRVARDLAARYQGGLVAKATAALETARFAYQSGATSQLDLLDAVRTYSDTRANYYSVLRDYWVSIYALDRAVGKDLVP